MTDLLTPSNGTSETSVGFTVSISSADVGPGRVAWFDITTMDLPEFYGKLFDWQFAPVQGSDQAAEIIPRGTPIGTQRVAEGKIGTFDGVVYVQVPDIQALGLVVDPSGHPIGMYSRTPIPPAPSPTK